MLSPGSQKKIKKVTELSETRIWVVVRMGDGVALCATAYPEICFTHLNVEADSDQTHV